MARKIITIVQYKRTPQIYYYRLDQETESGQEEYNSLKGIEDSELVSKGWISGYLSNEAPVKALLYESRNEAEPIGEIICLVSKEVKEDRILPGEQTCYELFQQHIVEYLKQMEMNPSEISFVQIEYRQENAEKCIREILTRFRGGDTALIDMTSGQRTLPLHVTLSMEAMAYMGVNIQDIVYAFWDSENLPGNTIYHAKHASRLIELIRAVNDFTRHGRSAALQECFHEPAVSEIKELCDGMKAFSDKLTICQIGEIDQDIQRINCSLNLLLAFKETLDGNERDGEKEDELRTIREQYINAPNVEKVFLFLIPAIQADFIQDGSKEKRTMDLIRWCVDRDMIQQALSLFRENAGRILIGGEKKYITVPEYMEILFALAQQSGAIDEHTSFENYAFERLSRLKEKPDPEIDWEKYPIEKKLVEKYLDEGNSSTKARKLARTETEPYNKEIRSALDRTFEVKPTFQSLDQVVPRAIELGFSFSINESDFHDIACYHFYLQYVRNTVMHASPVYQGTIKLSKKDIKSIDQERLYTDTYGNCFLKEIRLENKDEAGNRIALPNVLFSEVMDIRNIKDALKGAVSILERALSGE